MHEVSRRVTAPFTVFYRLASGEGGYMCETCNLRRHGNFARASDAFAAAAQHLNICRAALQYRAVEGAAIVNGEKYAVVLRAGIMILALNTVFRAAQQPVRVVV